jgi:hypothetical protein
MKSTENTSSTQALKKTQPEEFDLVILGGGTGSTVAAWTLGVENRQPRRAERRAKLTIEFYWSISKLTIDALVGPDQDGRYRMESSDDLANNPRGSTFQSFLHLFCNITNAPTDVYIYTKADEVAAGTFMYSPDAPSGGWDQCLGPCPVRF